MPSRAGTEKIHDFFITTVSGLEKAVLESLRAQLAGATGFETESDRRNGRIYFHYTRSPVKLTAVRSALAVAGVVSRFRGVTVGGPGLERVCERLRRADLSAARNLVRACHPEPTSTATSSPVPCPVRTASRAGMWKTGYAPS